MKSKILAQTMALGCLLAAGSAQSSPLQRADVPAEPVWIVNIDCDALRPTALGQFILAELEKPEAQGKLAAFQAIANVDLRRQVHGVTLYATSDAPQDGVLLLYAEFDSERLITLAKGANDYQATNHNQHVIHSWVDGHRLSKSGVGSRTYAATYAGRVIIFGQREATLAAALDVLDSSAPNLAGSRAFAQLGTSDGTFIQAAARKMNLASEDPGAAIFRLSKMMQLQVREANQKVTATLSLATSDEEVAKQITSIGQGLVALMKLQTTKPEAAKLADAVAISQDSAGVVATLAIPSNDLIELLKNVSAKKAEKKAE
jgi:hypothetical protein